MSEWTPEPQEFGWLEPPRKLPPTAVGVATPPPPHRPNRVAARRRSRLLRIASAVALGLTTVGAGMFIGLDLSLPTLLEIGAGLTTLEIATRFARGRRRFQPA